MTAHPLDRPVWAALTSGQAAFAEGGRLARRYLPGNIPFAATLDDSPASLAALAALLGDRESLILMQSDPIALPPGLVAVSRAPAVQMVAAEAMPLVVDERLEPLTEADAPAMLALAELTRPGPFSLKSMSLGEFWGVRLEGRLAGMAGTRMKYDGITELSGVCIHPDVQGRGLGRLLSVFMAGRISARGERPFLHAYDTNRAAIRLYESIGFRLRQHLNVAVIRRA